MLGLLFIAALTVAAPDQWQMQELATDLKVGYAVLLVDVDGDGLKDIVVVDTTRVLWFQNPSWRRRVITEGKTKPDNVCIAALDIDADGKPEMVLGAGWKGINTSADGPLYLLTRGAALDDPWNVHLIGDEPSVHRLRFADVDGDGKPELVVVPLLGHGSKQAMNFMDVPIKITAYKIPKDTTRQRWPATVISEELHVAHNFYPLPAGKEILTASYEGVGRLLLSGWGKAKWELLGAGNQSNPKSNRGASEIKQGHLASKSPYIATIEPWHGNEVVVYTPRTGAGLWKRDVLDDRLKWGHGVWCADLDGDGADEVIIGVRDNFSKLTGERCGVRIYKPTDGKWVRMIIDDGGIAVEDLAAADLDGDGRVDIVACGRATHNLRVYWNKKGGK